MQGYDYYKLLKQCDLNSAQTYTFIGKSGEYDDNLYIKAGLFEYSNVLKPYELSLEIYFKGNLGVAIETDFREITSGATFIMPIKFQSGYGTFLNIYNNQPTYCITTQDDNTSYGVFAYSNVNITTNAASGIPVYKDGREINTSLTVNNLSSGVSSTQSATTLTYSGLNGDQFKFTLTLTMLYQGLATALSSMAVLRHPTNTSILTNFPFVISIVIPNISEPTFEFYNGNGLIETKYINVEETDEKYNVNAQIIINNPIFIENIA